MRISLSFSLSSFILNEREREEEGGRIHNGPRNITALYEVGEALFHRFREDRNLAHQLDEAFACA